MTLTNAIIRFRDEVYAKSDTIDPNQNHDWHDLAMGFMLACGVPHKELSWGLLSDLSCGHFDKYLGGPLTPQEWVNTVFARNPELVTVRLGYGWANGTGHGATVWMDFVTDTGEHLAASQDNPLITVPDNITQWVINNVSLGEWVDYARPVDP